MNTIVITHLQAAAAAGTDYEAAEICHLLEKLEKEAALVDETRNCLVKIKDAIAASGFSPEDGNWFDLQKEIPHLIYAAYGWKVGRYLADEPSDSVFMRAWVKACTMARNSWCEKRGEVAVFLENGGLRINARQ